MKVYRDLFLVLSQGCHESAQAVSTEFGFSSMSTFLGTEMQMEATIRFASNCLNIL